MIDVMSEDYIRTARAKGLRERRVIFRHGLRSAGTPVVTAAGLDIGFLFGGTILSETSSTFRAWRLAYDAIANADLPMIQGTLLRGAFFIIWRTSSEHRLRVPRPEGPLLRPLLDVRGPARPSPPSTAC